MSGVSFDSVSQPTAEPLMQSPAFTKSSSHHPAFLALADHSAGCSDENLSKVFMKRNFLYSELKQVLVSVEQCASLFLLEDFLRNRIKTMDDVKALKTPPSFYGGGGAGRPTSSMQSNRYGR